MTESMTDLFCSEWPAQIVTCGSGKKKAIVSRFYTDTIHVVLPCGYRQKFWVDITDTEAIKRTKRMKRNGIKSA